MGGRRRPIDLRRANQLSSTSELGSRLLASSRRLDGNDNFAWIAGYSLVFEKCATSDEYYGGNFGGEGNNNNNDQNNFNGMYQQRLVHYKLCPTDDCSNSCSGGAEYVIDMGLFVEAFIESKMDAQEYNCEQVRENCYYDDEYQCYAEAGLDYCMDDEKEEGQMQFELEEAAECRELDVDEDALQYYYYQQGGNNQQNYNYNQNGGQQEMKLFVGPYCSADGKSIFLDVFMDEWCQSPAPAGTYEKFSYGQALPYSEDNLIDSQCLSCKEPQDENDQNNGDQDDEDEVLEICERLYEDAGKCESGLDDGVTYYPNTYACEFIKTLKAPGKTSRSKSTTSASVVFAWIFALSSVALSGVAFFFYNKAERKNVNLSSSGGTLI